MRLDAETRRAPSRQTAGGRRGGGSAAPGAALRIAPGKAAPAAPPPARPHRGGGTRPGPRSLLRGARLGAGVGTRGLATPAGCAWRWQRLLLRGEDPGEWRSSRYHSERRSWSPGTRGPGREELEAQGTLPELHALQPRRAGGAAVAGPCLGAAVGLLKLPQFILVETKNPESLRVDSPAPRPRYRGELPT